LHAALPFTDTLTRNQATNPLNQFAIAQDLVDLQICWLLLPFHHPSPRNTTTPQPP
jgi:hypothetical protein